MSTNSLEKILAELADASEEDKLAIVEAMSKEQRDALADAIEYPLLVEEAKNDDMRGFEAFYTVIYGRKPPKHVLGWIDKIGEAKDKNMFLLVEAFRGASKSTTMIAYLAHQIGLYPEKSNLVIGAGDGDAEKITSQVANIIQYNDGWKDCFPQIEPDPGARWGAGSGYEVKRSDMPYEKWRAVRQQDGKDPTFVGVGYRSKYIPGPHPTGVLLVDDIHNEDNTLSERELNKTLSIYTGTIIPMIEPTTVHVVIGTPWTFSDVIAHCRGSEAYIKIHTPVYQPDGSPTWPEKWDRETIEKRRKEVSNEIEMARMYYLDLEKTKGLTLKRDWLEPFWPHAEINDDWPLYIGVDFTSTEDPLKRSGDYFALAVGRVIPGGKGVVIEDGIRTRVSQAEAEDTVAAWAARYPTLQAVGIEAIITGKMFYNSLLNNAELRAANTILIPLSGGEFQKSKGYRYEKLMAPMFQRNRMYLTDNAENQFIKHFVDEWMNWQGDRLEKMHHNDTLDAVFNVMKVAEAFVMPIGAHQRKNTNPFFGGEKKKNPYANLGVK